MYQLNSEKMYFDMEDGQAVIINIASGVYYGVGLFGSAILDRILKGYSPSRITESIRQLPECPANIDEAVNEFITALQEKEIIIPGETVETGFVPVAAEAAAEGFSFTLDEYSEIRDLILADPVPEMDDNTTWGNRNE